ncbi:RNA-binding domain-containing protein [Methanococcus maripaludis]|uniref:ATP-dependent DNA helicase RecG n=1 Tax=Methanococcus maripaludis TaxID=39152 RepID=A0A7J9PP70_METMI|nr:RNA-binding domain-containing protein [Methanococcus maripaludis]MBA2864417.1 ATP-dependent DNA helicase RecG [Methanococcus maripaludis]
MTKLTKKQVMDLISTGEGYTLEFKKSFNKSIDKEICAFANADGGHILLGVDDSGKIIGYTLSNQDDARINDIARNMDPSFSVDIQKINNIVVITVPKGKDKPYSIGGLFYKRNGSQSQQLKREEIVELLKNNGLLPFEEKPNKEFDLKKDINKSALDKFITISGITNKLKKEDLLNNLCLIKDGFLKNAGVLYFCNNSTKFFRNAHITCVLYEGTSKLNILDRKDFSKDIYSNFNDSFEYICSKLNTEYIIGKERVERLELPKEAIREALVNSIAHRDYDSQGHIQIDIFQDKLEISNPGGLVSGLSESELGKRSIPRNPLLADLMLRSKLVERVGSGIIRIRESMNNYGLNCEFNVSENFFSTVLGRKQGFKLPFSFPVSFSSTDISRSDKIIASISENPKITILELSNRVGVSQNTVKKEMNILKEKGIIKRVGSPKGGHWEITLNTNNSA